MQRTRLPGLDGVCLTCNTSSSTSWGAGGRNKMPCSRGAGDIVRAVVDEAEA